MSTNTHQTEIPVKVTGTVRPSDTQRRREALLANLHLIVTEHTRNWRPEVGKIPLIEYDHDTEKFRVWISWFAEKDKEVTWRTSDIPMDAEVVENLFFGDALSDILKGQLAEVWEAILEECPTGPMFMGNGVATAMSSWKRRRKVS